MHKTTAIELLGGSSSKAADALEISYQGVDKWPEVLPRRISDRVLGAWVRLNLPERVESALAHAAQRAGQLEAHG